ncbi:MAG: RNA polymerase sigma-70 factor [Cyclobacteriaceae bacterium]|nr:RNA polymerase sigma-70 factor [Cyclobacteriaceae bacterium SS2]
MRSQQTFNEEEFEKLFREYFPYLCAFARKYVSDEADCKDIVHNVFLNLWQRHEGLDLSESLKSYLFKSVYNRCLNHIRDQKKILHKDLEYEPDALSAYAESNNYLEESELEMRIKRAVDNLPEKCRKIFILNRFQEKKYSEIAEIQGVSVKTIEAQMSKALKLLREQLIDYLVVLIILFQVYLGR